MWSRTFGVQPLLSAGINWGFLHCTHLSLLPPWGTSMICPHLSGKIKPPTRTLPCAEYRERHSLLLFFFFSLTRDLIWKFWMEILCYKSKAKTSEYFLGKQLFVMCSCLDKHEDNLCKLCAYREEKTCWNPCSCKYLAICNVLAGWMILPARVYCRMLG